MANPNIVNVSTIYGNTNVANVTTAAVAIVTNAAASGKIYKVNNLMITNVDSANAATITVDLYRSSVAYKIINALTVNINTSYTRNQSHCKFQRHTSGCMQLGGN